MPVITAALFARFASRQDESFAAKVTAALRNEFGGHAVQVRMTETPVAKQPARSKGSSSGARRTRASFVIFGASGDLTQRKLMPALYSLAYRRLLPGAVRRRRRRAHRGDGRRRSATRMEDAVKEHARDPFRDDVWEELADGMRYVATDFAERRRRGQLAQLSRARLDEERGTRRQPRSTTSPFRRARSATLVDALGKRRSATTAGSRLVIEKPFGHDLESARELNERAARSTSTESEIFRIDHYLGKETVQNMLALRFANGIFEPIWNRQFIDHVQITVAETIGIEGRGALLRAGRRDPRHRPEPPAAAARADRDGAADRLHAEQVRNEKVKVLRVAAHAGRRSRSSAGSTAPATSRARRCRATARRRASRRTR